MLIARTFRADLLDTFAKNAAEPVHANFGPPFPISIESGEATPEATRAAPESPFHRKADQEADDQVIP